ncbi:MAG: magnesium transporter CorA family protein [Nakamurella sp.]
MHGTLVIPDDATRATETVVDPGTDTLAARLAAGKPFWLDLDTTDANALVALRDTFSFHPLAVEDAEHFGQRPKIDPYDGFAFVVTFGVTADCIPIEVHCFYAEHFLVTVHHGAVPELDAAITRLVARALPLPAPIMLLQRVIDTLVDGYFPVLDAMDEAIDALEDSILRRPTDAQLGELFELKRKLVTLRRLASEQRDMFGSAMPGDDVLPGMTPEVERYFRDVYDHLVRISQSADSYRDLLSSVLDTHLSTTSNRLNVVMKQLAIIATVFLPMSFLTGFFGQNFAWMVNRIGGSWMFWIAGVGLQVLVAGGLLMMFRRKGWLGADADH